MNHSTVNVVQTRLKILLCGPLIVCEVNGMWIALRAARDGANVVIAAKTAEAHPKLPGTIYSAKEEIEAAGGPMRRSIFSPLAETSKKLTPSATLSS